jgi:hypothetical protein
MTYKLTIEQKATYIHAVVTGENNRENIIRYLEELLGECAARGCTRVLVEKRLEGPRLAIAEIFEIISENSRRALGMLRAIAYVDVYTTEDMLKFAETVAVNRALPLKVFLTVAEAEAWLSSKDPGNPDPTSKG